MSNGPLKISFSQIKTYSQCPLRYKFEYIDQKDTPNYAEVMHDGEIMHKMLELISEDPTFEGLEERINDVIMFYAKQYSFEQLKRCETIIRSWFTADSFPHKVLDVERYFNIPLKETFIISGIIDRIDEITPDKYSITDYKTGWHLYSDNEIENSIQLRIYAYAMFTMYPHLSSIVITYDNVRLKSQISKEIIRDELPTIEANLYAFICGLFLNSSKDYKARVGHSCIYCSYTSICNDYKEWISLEMGLEEGMTIEQIAGVYLRVNTQSTIYRRKRETLRDLLITIFQSQGIKKIDLGGQTITLSIGDRTELRVNGNGTVV